MTEQEMNEWTEKVYAVLTENERPRSEIIRRYQNDPTFFTYTVRSVYNWMPPGHLNKENYYKHDSWMRQSAIRENRLTIDWDKIAERFSNTYLRESSEVDIY